MWKSWTPWRNKKEIRNYKRRKRNKKRNNTILPIPEAKAPVIKIVYKGIPVDILIACVSFKLFDDNFNLDDDNILKNCCEKCILSLNGCLLKRGVYIQMLWVI